MDRRSAARADRAGRGGRRAVVALGVSLLLVNTVKLHRSAQATARSDAYLVAVDRRASALVVDAETGLRGYVITGRPLFLAPTRTGPGRRSRRR